MKARNRLTPESSRFFDDCCALRCDLDLYAEGELRSSSTLFRLRRHLEACEECQEYLEAHDALTREILAESPLLESALFEPRHDSLRVDPIIRLVEDDRRREEDRKRNAAAPWRGVARFAAPAAAAVLLLGLALSFSFSFWSRESSPADGVLFSGPFEEDSFAPPISLARHEGDLRWVLDRQGKHGDMVNNAEAPEPSSLSLRLYGVRSPADASGVVLSSIPPKEQIEWVVDAILASRGRPLSSDQFFLVPEASFSAGDSRGVVEIDPRAWSGWTGASGVARQVYGETSFYRVFVLHGAQSLKGSAPVLPPGQSPAILPVLGSWPSRPPHWTPPVTWEN